MRESYKPNRLERRERNDHKEMENVVAMALLAVFLFINLDVYNPCVY